MDYIKQLNAFELWLETNYLPGVSQLIWYKLFMLFNRCGWAEWVTVDNFRLMVLADIKSETTFITNRDKLIESGLLEYQKGKKSSPNKYKMIQLYIIENTPKNEVNICTPNIGVNMESKQSENDSQNGVNTADINKLNKNKTKLNNNERENTPARNKKIVPPTLEQITEYCNSRNSIVNPQTFYDYFTSGEDPDTHWIDSKGNPVINWKQKFITWENKNAQLPNNRESPRTAAKSINPFADYVNDCENEIEEIVIS